MAGKGGMNITHSEPFEDFVSRYGSRSSEIKPLLDAFGPEALRQWINDLGIATFVGSSGRVFPTDMKAAPLLRAWLHRLRELGVKFHMRHRWCGWNGELLRFTTPQGEVNQQVDAVLLALGGGSWARLGSDGAWVGQLTGRGIEVAPLKPANCGFDVNWSTYFSGKFAGHPLKSVMVSFADSNGQLHIKQGDLMVTASGIEGGLIYALSGLLRDQIDVCGSAVIRIDLLPGKTLSRVLAEVDHPRGARSMASHLQSRANIKGVKAGLLRELLPRSDYDQPEQLAAGIKSLTLKLLAARPLDEAISTAGGVTFEGLNKDLMLDKLPGIFCAGEMLDWEAPTGGYLLTACFASGRTAAQGVINWLKVG